MHKGGGRERKRRKDEERGRKRKGGLESGKQRESRGKIIVEGERERGRRASKGKV